MSAFATEGRLPTQPDKRHVDVVFDAARHRAVADAQIAEALVGVERHEDDLGTLLRGDARQLRELDVVADLDRDTAAVGVEHLDLVTADDSPPLPLGRS